MFEGYFKITKIRKGCNQLDKKKVNGLGELNLFSLI